MADVDRTSTAGWRANPLITVLGLVIALLGLTLAIGGVILAAAGFTVIYSRFGQPPRRALLVADLHLEKASWFARLGQMLPPYDSIATLGDLTALAATVLQPGFHGTTAPDSCRSNRIW